MPAGKGSKIPSGKINKTTKTFANEIEYSWSKVSKTKLKSPKSSIEMTKPTRSCKKPHKFQIDAEKISDNSLLEIHRQTNTHIPKTNTENYLVSNRFSVVSYKR